VQRSEVPTDCSVYRIKAATLRNVAALYRNIAATLRWFAAMFGEPGFSTSDHGPMQADNAAKLDDIAVPQACIAAAPDDSAAMPSGNAANRVTPQQCRLTSRQCKATRQQNQAATQQISTDLQRDEQTLLHCNSTQDSVREHRCVLEVPIVIVRLFAVVAPLQCSNSEGHAAMLGHNVARKACLAALFGRWERKRAALATTQPGTGLL